MHVYPIALGLPGPEEWIIILVIAVILFGKRLPEVGRSIGKGIVEFKKGLAGIDEEVKQSTQPTPGAKNSTELTNQQPAGQYKFDPYTGKPIAQPQFDPYTGKPLDQQQLSDQPESHV